MREFLAEPRPGLEEPLPDLEYILIDKLPCGGSDAHPRNLVDPMIRMAQTATPAELDERVVNLNEWLSSNESVELRKAFTTWIDRTVLRKRFPDATLEIDA